MRACYLNEHALDATDRLPLRHRRHAPAHGRRGRRAMRGAFDDVLRARTARAALDFSFAGMTDRAIVRQGPSRRRRAGARRRRDRSPARGLPRRASTTRSRRRTRYRVLPGVHGRALVAHAPSVERIAIGLGTGNVKRGRVREARARLARHDVRRSAGSAATRRTAPSSCASARERGAAALGAARSRSAASSSSATRRRTSRPRTASAPSASAVGTGGFEPRALLELGAHSAFATLEHDGVRDALTGQVTQGAGNTARASGV